MALHDGERSDVAAALEADARAALTGIIASIGPCNAGPGAEHVARLAFGLADAMAKVRAERVLTTNGEGEGT